MAEVCVDKTTKDILRTQSLLDWVFLLSLFEILEEKEKVRVGSVMVAYQTDLRGIKVHSEGWSSNLPDPATGSLSIQKYEYGCHPYKTKGLIPL